MRTAKRLPVLFKGASPGTHWHQNDARLTGFNCAANRLHTINAVVGHITAYSHPSPYISFSTSFAVARQYALLGPGGPASADAPGWVYEVDPQVASGQLRAFDPIEEVAAQGLAQSHNGDQDLILGLASASHAGVLTAQVEDVGGRQVLPRVSKELQALVYALRDGEVLLAGMPAACVIGRHAVF